MCQRRRKLNAVEKLVVAQIVKKFPEFYRTRCFVMVSILSNMCTHECKLQHVSAQRCQHQGVITKKVHKPTCLYIYIAHSYNHNWKVWLLKSKIIYCWNLGVETCSSLCMSCVLYHEEHLLDNMLITRTCTVWIAQNFVTVFTTACQLPAVWATLSHPHSFDIHFSIIFPSTPRFPMNYFSSRLIVDGVY